MIRSSVVFRGSRPWIMIDAGPLMMMMEAALNVQKRAREPIKGLLEVGDVSLRDISGGLRLLREVVDAMS